MQLNPFKIIRRAYQLYAAIVDTYEWIQVYILPQLNEETRQELSERTYQLKKQAKELI